MWNQVIDDWKTPVEYIDREAAVLALAEQGFDYDKAKQALASVPAADVALIKHAHWIEQGETQICSNCGEEHTWSDYCAAYCDCCGAHMRIERYENDGIY